MDSAQKFVCLRCGACCRAPGEVRLAPDEIETIAAALDLTIEAFIARHTRLTWDRRGLTLIDQANGACTFLSDDNECRIQHVKPRQCRDYPSRWRNDELDAGCAAQRKHMAE